MRTLSDWRVVDGSPTYILQRGSIQSGRPLILIIPGNPGVADFYAEFIDCIANQSSDRLPVACISHAGHVSLPEHIAKTHGGRNKWYMVKDQVRHKLAFIEAEVPPGTPLILIGHSIGCYMILQMLRSLDRDRVLKCYLLFPTIERLSGSESGKVFAPLLRYLVWTLPFFTYPFYYLVPDFIKRFLVQTYFRQQPVPRCAYDGVMKLMSPAACGNSAHLANDELQLVQEADYDIIESSLDRLFFYYGADDHWCPVEYYEQMKSRFPDADIHLCERKLKHAFVLESSSEMAAIIWKLIKAEMKAI